MSLDLRVEILPERELKGIGSLLTQTSTQLSTYQRALTTIATAIRWSQLALLFMKQRSLTYWRRALGTMRLMVCATDLIVRVTFRRMFYLGKMLSQGKQESVCNLTLRARLRA